jgi:WD40 repeat protein
MFFKPDDSVWMQAGNSPPEFMARLPTAFRFDDALHYGVMARAGRAQVLDLATRSVVADAPAPPLAPRVDVSDDGSTAVATGSEQRLLWWRRGMRQWQSQPLELASPDLRISPNGERVLISAFSGGPEVRDLVSGRRYPLAMTNIVRAQFLDDEHVVAVDGSGAVWRWSLAHARSWVLADHFGKAWMWGFAVCDHGQSVLTATNRKDRAILISSPSGAPQRELARARDAQIYGIACAGDRVFAGTRDGHLLEWEWPSGRQLADHDTGVRAWIWTVLTAQPVAGNRVTVFGTGQIFDLEKRSGGRVMTLRAGAPTELYRAQFGRNTGIDEIAISSDGRTAAAVTSSGELIRIDLAAGTTSRSAVTQTGEVRRVRYTAEDHTLVTAGEDGYLRTWRADDLTLQSEIYVGHGWLDDLDVHGTTALVATMEGHVGEWDLVTRRLVLDHRGYGAVAMARFDASGRWIVSGDSDGHACVHRTGQEGCYAALVGHKPAGPIRHMQFLADGQIITASDDGTVWQWNPPYEVSNSELARELQGYLFDRGKLPAAGAMAPSPGSRPRLRR